MVKYYIDTSVWRDYFEDRSDGLKPLGEFAFQFLRKCRERRDIVLVSNVVIKELRKYLSENTIKEIFLDFEEIIIEIESTKEQEIEAYYFWHKTKKQFPLFDILHSIIARDLNAIVVSRDKHFEEIGIVKTRLPEELI